MGLAERRAAKEFQDKNFPKLQEEIHKHAGFPVPLEVNWEQLTVDEASSYYVEAWTEIFFKPVIEGLRTIGRDAMGKEALKASLKKIEFRNSKDTANPSSAITFDNGTLVIDHKLSNVGDTAERTKTLVEIVEKAL